MKKTVESIFNLLMPNDEGKRPAEPYSKKIFYVLFLIITFVLLLVVL